MDAASFKIDVTGVSVATQADCSNLTSVLSVSAGYTDWASNPDLGTLTLGPGIYDCVALTIDSVITFTPATTLGTCVAGTEYTEDLCEGHGCNSITMYLSIAESVSTNLPFGFPYTISQPLVVGAGQAQTAIFHTSAAGSVIPSSEVGDAPPGSQCLMTTPTYDFEYATNVCSPACAGGDICLNGNCFPNPPCTPACDATRACIYGQCVAETNVCSPACAVAPTQFCIKGVCITAPPPPQPIGVAGMCAALAGAPCCTPDGGLAMCGPQLGVVCMAGTCQFVGGGGDGGPAPPGNPPPNSCNAVDGDPCCMQDGAPPMCGPQLGLVCMAGTCQLVGGGGDAGPTPPNSCHAVEGDPCCMQDGAPPMCAPVIGLGCINGICTTFPGSNDATMPPPDGGFDATMPPPPDSGLTCGHASEPCCPGATPCAPNSGLSCVSGTCT